MVFHQESAVLRSGDHYFLYLSKSDFDPFYYQEIFGFFPLFLFFFPFFIYLACFTTVFLVTCLVLLVNAAYRKKHLFLCSVVVQAVMVGKAQRQALEETRNLASTVRKQRHRSVDIS